MQRRKGDIPQEDLVSWCLEIYFVLAPQTVREGERTHFDLQGLINVLPCVPKATDLLLIGHGPRIYKNQTVISLGSPSKMRLSQLTSVCVMSSMGPPVDRPS